MEGVITAVFLLIATIVWVGVQVANPSLYPGERREDEE